MTIFITLIRTLVIMHCSMQVQGFLHCTNLSIESSYLCTKKAKNAESLWGLLPCQSLSCPYFALVNFIAPPNCQITVHTFFNAEEFQGHFPPKKIYLVSIILQFIESTLGVQKVAFMKKNLETFQYFRTVMEHHYWKCRCFGEIRRWVIAWHFLERLGKWAYHFISNF